MRGEMEKWVKRSGRAEEGMKERGYKVTEE